MSQNKSNMEAEEPLVCLQEVGLDYKLSRRLFHSSTSSVLRDISFSINPGESVGVIGKNGAGKSSLLRLLAGIIRPDKGKITFNCKHAALLSLQVGFNNELDGRDNIILSGMLMGFTKQDVKQKLGEIIDYSELGLHINKAVKTYSLGMRARLGFSIAIQMSPDLLLIDETLGVGDAGFREKSDKALKEKIASDQTVVLVSHQAGTIKSLCDRAIWIEDGYIVSIGNAKEVVNAYESSQLNLGRS